MARPHLKRHQVSTSLKYPERQLVHTYKMKSLRTAQKLRLALSFAIWGVFFGFLLLLPQTVRAEEDEQLVAPRIISGRGQWIRQRGIVYSWRHWQAQRPAATRRWERSRRLRPVRADGIAPFFLPGLGMKKGAAAPMRPRRCPIRPAPRR